MQLSFGSLWLLCIALLIALHVSGYLIGFVVLSYLSIQLLLTYRFLREQDRRLDSISNLIAALLQQDYSLRGHDTHQAHYNELLGLINQLAATLQHHQRHRLLGHRLQDFQREDRAAVEERRRSL